jgi:membrane protein
MDHSRCGAGGCTRDALMSTTARRYDLKRDLARLERKRTGSPRQGRTVDEGGRGREAEHPGQIPSRGWMDVLWRAWGEVGDANLFLIAGGVTSALILTLFSGLAALVSLYGLPAQTKELLSQELHSLVATSSGALGLGAVIGILLALWSASRGMSGIITALNIACEEKERRG